MRFGDLLYDFALCKIIKFKTLFFQKYSKLSANHKKQRFLEYFREKKSFFKNFGSQFGSHLIIYKANLNP